MFNMKRESGLFRSFLISLNIYKLYEEFEFNINVSCLYVTIQQNVQYQLEQSLGIVVVAIVKCIEI